MARDGYQWWYVDALSDDERFGITLIAFIGSVFSPYYASARRRGAGEPLHYCALNIALYGKRGKRWAMTERARAAVRRFPSQLEIGPSSLTWDGNALTVDIDEVTVPLPSRIRGLVRLYPAAITSRAFTLDAKRRHRWWPVAPSARVEVNLERPRLRWAGAGYLDTNAGDEPLEHAFTDWNWSRAGVRDGTAVLYEVNRRDNTKQSIAIRCDATGDITDFDLPPAAPLPTTALWRVPRGTRTEHGTAEVMQTLEDTPFYARSVLATRLLGQPVTAMHESLSLNRFRTGWVRLLLRFRMPRAAP